MSTLTIRLPDAKHDRLKSLAQARDISVNRLFDEWATIALTQFDAQNRYAARAARGNTATGLALLEKLDASFM